MTPLAAIIAFSIIASQTKKLGDITKTYVTFGFLLKIDNMFAVSLPEQIQENAVNLNQSGLLKLKEDHNTYKHLALRLFNRKKICSPSAWINFISNVGINIWFFFISNV